jgi:phosphopantetheinyl transferase
VTPPSALSARRGHVDVRATSLDPAPPTLARLERCLDTDERARAARFVFERDARRFRIARGVRALPPGQREAAFFACWTRKEAFIKSLGAGLSYPLDAFTVSFAAGEPACLLEVRGEPAAAARWTLVALDIGVGYAAAVAVDRPATVTVRGSWEQSSGS